MPKIKSTTQLAKHLREVFTGGNWTFTNVEEVLKDVTVEEALTKVFGLNSIAGLLFHMNYYFKPVLGVLKGEALTGNDKFSFDLPPIGSETEWKALVKQALDDAEALASQIEMLEEGQLAEIFADPKFGIYYRNLLGIIEHTHYHLGQIALIKKILRSKPE
jgi:uncharacterized damage-inducible protein DinB